MKPGFGNIQSTFSASRAWTPQRINTKILFWGKVSEISGGQMPNKITGSSDYLTVAGSPATYQCPNTTPYINADTDKVWFYSDGTTIRSVLTSDLISFDFSRTLVKYDDTTPYAIREIIILTTGATLTTTEMNHLRDYMQLSAWWDNTLSFHGDSKGNRTTGQLVWTPVAQYEAETIALLTAMTVQPDDTRKTVINNFYLAAKARSYWAKCIKMTLAAHTEQAYCLNVMNPATFTMTPGGSPAPVYTTDRGGAGNGSTAYYDTGFNPSTNGGAIYTQEDCSWFVYLRLNKAEAASIGGGRGSVAVMDYFYPRDASNWLYIRFNDANGGAIANSDSRGFFGVVRDSVSGNPTWYIGKSGTVEARPTVALPNANMWLLGNDNQGTLTSPCTNQVAFEWRGGALTSTEVGNLQDDVLAYLTAIGANV